MPHLGVPNHDIFAKHIGNTEPGSNPEGERSDGLDTVRPIGERLITNRKYTNATSQDFFITILLRACSRGYTGTHKYHKMEPACKQFILPCPLKRHSLVSASYAL